MKKLCIYLLMIILPFTAVAQDPVDSLKNLVETADDSTKVSTLLVLSRIYLSRNLLESVDYATRALELAREIGNLELQSNALSHLGAARYYQGNFETAREVWLEDIELLRRMEEIYADDSLKRMSIKNDMAQLLNNVGVVYKNAGEYDKAIEYYQENLRIQEEFGSIMNMARGHANIGNVYFYFGLDYNKALEYYNTSLELFRQYAEKYSEYEEAVIEGKNGMATNYLNIGMVYKEMNNMGMAIDNYRKALRIFREIDDKPGIANTQNQMGLVYLEGGSYDDALSASMNALNLYREIGNRKEVAATLKNVGNIYYRWGRYEQALDYFNQSLALNQELNLKKEIYDVYKDISDTYATMGNFKRALDNYQKYNELKDSSIREENIRQISELETKYETERVERENELLNTQNMLQETELKRQRVMIYSLVGIFLVILASSFLLFRAYRAIKHANFLLEEQNIEIKHQRDQIFQQKQEITDSIHYASRIQNALLPPEKLLGKLSDHFILYKPRDIVSGDYYWMTQKDGKTVILAADCTGHGVPGAFMSMLGISFMNEIVNKSDMTQPNEILNKLRDNVVNSLHQTGEEGEAQDGMDLALCVINNDKSKLQYSGAYNPLFLIRDDELIEYKPDKMPIGIYKEKQDSFTNHEIDIREEDALYMFSDGYVDQFGGPGAKKFMAKRFKELLLSIYKKPMTEQKNILDTTLEEWKGGIDQIDDILVMGIRI
jgi:serine phosphatase RsbU (regulator of sigma subunit)/Tfp pilus assembly protein PilF